MDIIEIKCVFTELLITQSNLFRWVLFVSSVKGMLLNHSVHSMTVIALNYRSCSNRRRQLHNCSLFSLNMGEEYDSSIQSLYWFQRAFVFTEICPEWSWWARLVVGIYLLLNSCWRILCKFMRNKRFLRQLKVQLWSWVKLLYFVLIIFCLIQQLW